MDFKAKIAAKVAENRDNQVGGAIVSQLQSQLDAHDQDIVLQ